MAKPVRPYTFMHGVDLRVNKVPWEYGVQVALIEWGQDGRTPRMVTSLETSPVPDGMALQPLFRLDETQAQRLMDDLWASGFRPTEGRGSAGAMAAVEKHRDDLRELVFRFMDQIGARKR